MRSSSSMTWKILVLLSALAVVACSQGAESPITNILPTNPPSTATPTPSPTPQAALTVQSTGGPSSSIVINFTTAGAAMVFTASESGYTNTFSIVNGCSSGKIATLTPTSASGPTALFTLTSQNAGTCSIVIGDAFGQTTNVSVIVTTTSGTIQ